MARKIHYYKTRKEFEAAYLSSGYTEPWTSYVKRLSPGEDYKVDYNRMQAPASRLWIDDFPDGTSDGYETPYDAEFVEDKYGYETMDEYFDDIFMTDFDSYGINFWDYLEDFTFNDNEYFLYGLPNQYTEGVYSLYGLMPKTYTTEQLVNLSVSHNYNNRFQPFDYVLEGDFDLVYTLGNQDPSPGKLFVLVDIEI